MVTAIPRHSIPYPFYTALAAAVKLRLRPLVACNN